MKYMGSKSKIAKSILPIINARMRQHNLSTYVEPFVGGANVIDKVSCEKRIGCDNQEYLIALFQNLDRLQELPPFIPKEHYSYVRECYNKKKHVYESWYIGAIGFLASYNGRFFDGGYAGIVNTKQGTVRDYYAEAKRNLEAQVESLKGIEWRTGDYRETCSDLEDCLIYCDPPYKGAKQYGTNKEFVHEEFWDWCRIMSEKNIVLISEHEAPSDFECIWQQNTYRTMNHGKPVRATEKLFEIGGKSKA